MMPEVSSMVQEIRAQDLLDADRDENSRVCDHCAATGKDFYNGFWLCEGCLLRMREHLEVAG